MGNEVVLRTLKDVENLIRDPAHWTKNFFAVDATGRATSSTSEDAVAWCLLGAAVKACADGPECVFTHGQLYDRVKGELDSDTPVSLTWLNDCKGHEEVLSLLHKTISRLESSPCSL